MGRLAAEARRLKANRHNVRVLAAGDRFQGMSFSTVNKWPMLAGLDALVGYDAITPGNPEWNEGCAVLADFIRALGTPVLAANLESGPIGRVCARPFAAAHAPRRPHFQAVNGKGAGRETYLWPNC